MKKAADLLARIRRGRFPLRAPRPWLTAALMLVVFLLGMTLHAQQRPTEYDVKAAYLFNFGKFERPTAPAPAPRSSFLICVLGQDPFGGALDRITANEQIAGRPVRTERVKEPGDARECDILFIPASEASRMDRDLAAVQGLEVLTVSDAPQFLEHGGMIQLVMQGNRVRFAVDLDAVTRGKLALSSELLKVASSVTGKAGSEEPQ